MPLIYCVEDDIEIQKLIIYALENSAFKVRGFSNSRDLFSRLKFEKPDLILLDIMLPGKDGINILKEIRSDLELKDIPVIFLTAKTSEYDRVKGLDLGADDYIIKPFSVMELIARVKALLRRVGAINNINKTPISYKEISLNPQTRIVLIEGENVDLTYKEFEVLYYLIINKGIALSRKKILEEVWGYDYLGESRTVDVHIGSLRKKLKVYGGYIKTVRNIGYKLGE